MQIISRLKYILLLVVLLLPLLGVSKGLGFEQIKVFFFILSITLMGFLWMGRGFKWSLISIISSLFILILLITSLLSLNIQTSFLGSFPYFQGWILYSYLFLFYLMVKTFKIELKNYAIVLSVSALIVALLAVQDWILLNIFHQQVITYAGRVVSSFGQPNFYAGFLLLTLPFSYFLFKNSNKKLQILGWGSGMLSFIGILLSYSRAAVLLGLGLLVFALTSQLRVKKILIIILFILLGSIFLSIKFSSGFVWQEFFQPATVATPDLTQQSAESRVYIWPQALKIISQKPILGYGLENINTSFSNYFLVNKHALFEENLHIVPILLSLRDLDIDRTHNYTLDLLLFSGILGLAAWIGVILLAFKKILQDKVSIENNILLVGLVTYLVWIQFQNQSVVHLVYFWLIVGLIDS